MRIVASAPPTTLSSSAWRKRRRKPSPVLAGDVAEAVLRERLLDGEVEEDLEEPHDDERRGEHAELVGPEDACRDDRPGDAEGDGA